MAQALYVLTCLTTLLCAVLLLRGWLRVRRNLLLWSGLCFAGLTLAHFLTILDLVLLPDVDLYTWRLGTTAVSMALLLYGLVWESQ